MSCVPGSVNKYPSAHFAHLLREREGIIVLIPRWQLGSGTVVRDDGSVHDLPGS